MHVSSGRPHILTSNQRGRGNDPVTVLGRIRSAVAVNMGFLQPALYCDTQVSRPFHKYADVLQTVAHALKRAASALQPTLVLREQRPARPSESFLRTET